MLLAAAGRASGFGMAAGRMPVRALARAASPQMASLYDFSSTKIDGSALSMSDFKGKPVLILNVASL